MYSCCCMNLPREKGVLDYSCYCSDSSNSNDWDETYISWKKTFHLKITALVPLCIPLFHWHQVFGKENQWGIDGLSMVFALKHLVLLKKEADKLWYYSWKLDYEVLRLKIISLIIHVFQTIIIHQHFIVGISSSPSVRHLGCRVVVASWISARQLSIYKTHCWISSG